MIREHRTAEGYVLRLVLYVVLGFGVACVPCIAQDETIEVPITDGTRGVSPLEIHGRALIREVISGPEIQWSWGAKVVVKNISDKPITLLLATFTERGRHPESGHHGGLGDGPTYDVVEDRFFGTDIGRAQSVVLRDTKPSVLARGCCVNSVDKVRGPEAEFKVLFVQYADGSIFGDPSVATEVFARRRSSIAALQQLVESRADDEKGFSEQFEQRCASLGSVCPQIGQALERNGERSAITEIRRLLAIAEIHARLLDTAHSLN